VNGVAGTVFSITFANNWTGANNNQWNNPGNWSCNTVPDANTDVTINIGNVVINSNTIIRSLTTGTGAGITVTAGNTLTVTH